ncbi:hypothetical protein [Paraburkholderia ferrariae]|uniref:hypothetical protein n=1 Tax=Paraburkholderia ferrariae TaxID=386056 RepID=UPI000A06F3BE|nr:hypothetical protein [Paraburkholderia ferrariae]
MEHLVRIVNEADREALVWLRQQAGDTRVERAARQLGQTHKPFVSALYRYLGVRRPAMHHVTPGQVADHSVGDYYLARIRQQLARHVAR